MQFKTASGQQGNMTCREWPAQSVVTLLELVVDFGSWTKEMRLAVWSSACTGCECSEFAATTLVS